MSKNTENRHVNVYHNVKETGKTIRQLEKDYFKLRAEVKGLGTNTKEYKSKLKELQGAKASLDQHRNQINGVNRAWQQTKSVMLGVVGAASGMMIFQRVMQFIPDLIRRNAELSDSYADVMKTTGLSLDQVRAMDKQFKGFNTRTPRAELLALAKTAGRMNVEGSKNIANFVKEADQLQVALGEDLGEDAVLNVAKLAAAFDTSILKIGSAVNELGNSTRAQEGYIVDFMARMQGAGTAVGLSAAEIAGYGAMLDSFGQKVEMSGTALSTTIMDFVKNTEKFESVAGMAEGSLKKLIGEEGTNAGFIAFIEKLKESSTGQDDFLKKLEAVGINGARGAQVFLTIANNLDEVKRAQGIANDAIEKGTSLTDEYNIKNENLAANLAKLGKELGRMWSTSGIQDSLSSMIKSLQKLIAIPVSVEMEKNRAAFKRLEFQIYDTNTPAAKRIELIQQLKTEHPQHLANIDAETVGNRELQRALMGVNEGMMMQIRIQRQVEAAKVIEDKAKIHGNAAARFEDDIRSLMAAVEDLTSTNHQIKINSNAGDIKDQAEDIISKLSDDIILRAPLEQRGNAQEQRQLIKFREELILKTRALSGAQKAMNHRLSEEQKILEEINRLKADEFYASQPDVSAGGYGTDNAPVVPVGGDDITTELSDNETKKIDKLGEEAMKAYEKLLADVQKISDEVFYAALPDTDQALIKINEHYDALRQAAVEAMDANDADTSVSEDTRAIREQQILDQIKLINQTHDAAMDQYYAEKQAERDAARQVRAEEVWLMNEDQMNQEIIRLMQDFDTKAALLEEHGYDTLALTEEIEKAIQAVKDKYRDADLAKEQDHLAKKKAFQDDQLGNTIMMFDALGGLMNSYADMQSSYYKEDSKKQKDLADFTLKVNTVMAIAVGVLKAMQASTPYEAIILALGMAGTVMTAMGQAKQMNASTSVPAYEHGTGMGGHRGGMMLTGEQGPEISRVPVGSEVYTASRTAQMMNWDSTPTRSFDAAGANESVRSSYGDGAKEGIAELAAAFKQMSASTERWQREFKVINVKEDYDEFEERISNIKRIGNIQNDTDASVFRR